MIELPQNTLVDILGPADGLDQDACDALKAIYLASPLGQAMCAEHGMTPAQLINAVEKLRRRGLLVIERDEAQNSFRLTLAKQARAILDLGLMETAGRA